MIMMIFGYFIHSHTRSLLGAVSHHVGIRWYAHDANGDVIRSVLQSRGSYYVERHPVYARYTFSSRIDLLM